MREKKKKSLTFDITYLIKSIQALMWLISSEKKEYWDYKTQEIKCQ